MKLNWATVTQDVGGKSAVADHHDVWRSATAPYFIPNIASDVLYANVPATSFAYVVALSSTSYYYAVTAASPA